MTNFWTQILDFAHTTTHRVGEQLLKDFGQVQAAEKADGSLVTQSDRWADQELRWRSPKPSQITASSAKKSNTFSPRPTGAGLLTRSMAPPTLPEGYPCGASRWGCFTRARPFLDTFTFRPCNSPFTATGAAILD